MGWVGGQPNKYRSKFMVCHVRRVLIKYDTQKWKYAFNISNKVLYGLKQDSSVEGRRVAVITVTGTTSARHDASIWSTEYQTVTRNQKSARQHRARFG
jgi:hypothetical protein